MCHIDNATIIDQRRRTKPSMVAKEETAIEFYSQKKNIFLSSSNLNQRLLELVRLYEQETRLAF